MIHHYIEDVESLNSSAHYAVAPNGLGDVLIQLDDGERQVRVKLTLKEALHFKALITLATDQAVEYYVSRLPKYAVDE